MSNARLKIFSRKSGNEQKDGKASGWLRKALPPAAVLLVLALGLILFTPDAKAGHDFECELVYVGIHEVGLRIGHQATNNNDGEASFVYHDYRLTILRYLDGQSPDSAQEVVSYTFPSNAGLQELFFYDENVESEVTYKYRIKGDFPYTILAPGAPPEAGIYSSTRDSSSIYGMYSATPGHVWGDLPRDTTWDGELNIFLWLTVKDGLTLVVPSSVSIGGSSSGYLHVYGALQIDGATFTGDSLLVPHFITAEEGNPQISIKNASVQSWLEIDASGHDAGLIFEGNSGDAYCSIKVGAGATNNQIISGNRLPDGRISGYPTGNLAIEDNTLLWITLEGQEEAPGPGEGRIEITGNEILQHIRLKGLADGTTAGIAENRFGGTRGWIELSDCLPDGTGGLEIRSNQAMTYMILDNVNSATVRDNQIGRATTYSFNPFSLEIRKGLDNVIQANIFTSPPQLGITNQQMGIGLGLAGDEASGNRILDNVFQNYHTGIGLGTANENLIAGNTFESNLFSLHLKGNIAGGPGRGHDGGHRLSRAPPAGNLRSGHGGRVPGSLRCDRPDARGCPDGARRLPPAKRGAGPRREAGLYPPVPPGEDGPGLFDLRGPYRSRTDSGDPGRRLGVRLPHGRSSRRLGFPGVGRHGYAIPGYHLLLVERPGHRDGKCRRGVCLRPFCRRFRIVRERARQPGQPYHDLG